MGSFGHFMFYKILHIRSLRCSLGHCTKNPSRNREHMHTLRADRFPQVALASSALL